MDSMCSVWMSKTANMVIKPKLTNRFARDGQTLNPYDRVLTLQPNENKTSLKVCSDLLRADRPLRPR